MRPPCASMSAAATLRCQAMLSAGDWRSSVLTRCVERGAKCQSATSAPHPLVGHLREADARRRWMIRARTVAPAGFRTGRAAGPCTCRQAKLS